MNRGASAKKQSFMYDKRLQDKWWHRLAIVLMIGTTILLALILYYISFSNLKWTSYRYIYNFESSYNSVEGIEVQCLLETSSARDDELINRTFAYWSLKCGKTWTDISEQLNFKQKYIRRYNIQIPQAKEGYTLLYKYKKLYNVLNDEVFNYKLYGYEDVGYDEIFSIMIYKKQIVGVMAKIERVVEYTNILKAIILPAIMAFIWFLILRSLVYRTVIFIIFGKE